MELEAQLNRLQEVRRNLRSCVSWKTSFKRFVLCDRVRLCWSPMGHPTKRSSRPKQIRLHCSSSTIVCRLVLGFQVFDDLIRPVCSFTHFILHVYDYYMDVVSSYVVCLLPILHGMIRWIRILLGASYGESQHYMIKCSFLFVFT